MFSLYVETISFFGNFRNYLPKKEIVSTYNENIKNIIFQQILFFFSNFAKVILLLFSM